jgi:hypothetical protein
MTPADALVAIAARRGGIRREQLVHDAGALMLRWPEDCHDDIRDALDAALATGWLILLDAAGHWVPAEYRRTWRARCGAAVAVAGLDEVADIVGGGL